MSEKLVLSPEDTAQRVEDVDTAWLLARATKNIRDKAAETRQKKAALRGKNPIKMAKRAMLSLDIVGSETNAKAIEKKLEKSVAKYKNFKESDEAQQFMKKVEDRARSIRREEIAQTIDRIGQLVPADLVHWSSQKDIEHSPVVDLMLEIGVKIANPHYKGRKIKLAATPQVTYDYNPLVAAMGKRGPDEQGIPNPTFGDLYDAYRLLGFDKQPPEVPGMGTMGLPKSNIDHLQIEGTSYFLQVNVTGPWESGAEEAKYHPASANAKVVNF